jgi:hypothetical protein
MRASDRVVSHEPCAGFYAADEPDLRPGTFRQGLNG